MSLIFTVVFSLLRYEHVFEAYVKQFVYVEPI
jgi:hypothetical protein